MAPVGSPRGHHKGNVLTGPDKREGTPTWLTGKRPAQGRSPSTKSAGQGQGLPTHLLPCRDEGRWADLLLATCQRIVDDEFVAGVSDEQNRVFELGGADGSF